jgi:hypothetical protein
VLALATVACLPVSAVAGQSAVIDKLLDKVNHGEHTSGDRDLVKLQTLAACSLSRTVESLAFRDAKVFEAQIQDTIRAVDGALATVRDELKKPTHGKRVDLTQWKNVTDLDLTGVLTQRDLLNRILALITSQRKILSDMTTMGNEDELARALPQAIRIGGQISRMLTVYLTS